MLPPPCFSLNARTSFSVQVDIVTLYSLRLPNTQCLHTMREGLVSRLAIVTHKRRVRNYSMNCIHTTPHHKHSRDPAWRTRRNSHSACSPPACAVYLTDLRAFASFLQTLLYQKILSQITVEIGIFLQICPLIVAYGTESNRSTLLSSILGQYMHKCIVFYVFRIREKRDRRLGSREHFMYPRN